MVESGIELPVVRIAMSSKNISSVVRVSNEFFAMLLIFPKTHDSNKNTVKTESNPIHNSWLNQLKIDDQRCGSNIGRGTRNVKQVSKNDVENSIRIFRGY